MDYKFDESLYFEMIYLFTGIEDGWIVPNKHELELYYSYTKWIEGDKQY